MAKEEIQTDKLNARIHSPANKDAIKKSLQDLGAGRSVLIDSENVVIAGNGVFEQAQKLGIPVKIIESDGTELVVVKRTDLDTGDKKRTALAIADNRANDLSEFDTVVLDKMLEKLTTELQQSAGFTAIEMETIKILTENINNLPTSDHWQDMPEFIQDNKSAFRSIIIHFKNKEDINEFAKIINQTITEKTKFLWFPKQEQLETESRRYKSES